MTSRYAELLRGAEAIAARAAQTLCAMRDGALDVSRKELRDVVTAADLASERVVLEGLRTLTPDAAIVSEEAGASGPTGGGCWIVDPLDGTANFASGVDRYAIIVCLVHDTRTIGGWHRFLSSSRKWGSGSLSAFKPLFNLVFTRQSEFFAVVFGIL